MFLGAACLMVVLGGARAGGWRWPDEAGAASTRIDTKVRFVDDDARRPNKVQADEIKPPLETEGFYNRPAAGAGSGRYAVQAEPHAQRLHDVERPAYSDGTLDSLKYCKCVASSGHACRSRPDLPKACSPGMHLCCYKRPNRTPQHIPEIFTELEDDRPMLLPNHEKNHGPFVTPDDLSQVFVDSDKKSDLLFGPRRPTGPEHYDNRILVGPSGPTGLIGPNQRNPGVLVGPDGPTGVIGPARGDNRFHPGSNQRNPGVLVGPGGPTGVIGPAHRDSRLHVGVNQNNPGVLVGPNGPSGVIGPDDHVEPSRPNKQGLLIGPDGPTGLIGPNYRDGRVFGEIGPVGVLRPNQRNPGLLVGSNGPTGSIGLDPDGNSPWVLIGPGGPTGGIGPDQHKSGVHSSNQGSETAQVLVGPGGPTGIIGPGDRRGRWQTGPGLLVGPGGPTGIIGPGQRLLVGPGGPTGRLGPRGYGQYGF